jgi:hypothetical protein
MGKVKAEVRKAGNARWVVSVTYPKTNGINLALDSQLDASAIKYGGTLAVDSVDHHSRAERELTFDFTREESAAAFAGMARSIEFGAGSIREWSRPPGPPR